MAFVKVDEDLKIVEYHIRGKFDGESHVVVRVNRDGSNSIVCRGTLADCKKFCGIP